MNSVTKFYDDLPKIAKLLIQIILGGVIGGLYRILKFVETKNIVTLIVGIVCLVTGVGNAIAWVADIITVALYNKITLFAD